MDIKEVRTMLRSGGEVVILEDGQVPLVVRELRGGSVGAGMVDHPEEEVRISSRLPTSRPPIAATQDAVLERLNNEILLLKEQIAQEESQGTGQDN